MSLLPAATTGATTASAIFSSAIGTPNLPIRVRAPANTINRCNSAGGKTSPCLPDDLYQRQSLPRDPSCNVDIRHVSSRSSQMPLTTPTAALQRYSASGVWLATGGSIPNVLAVIQVIEKLPIEAVNATRLSNPIAFSAAV